MIDTLISNVAPFGGSALIGYIMGAALKRVLKWILIIVGVLAGLLFMGIQLLHRYGYVGTVNWDKLGNDLVTQIEHYAASVDMANLHGVFNALGIEVGSGLGIGLLAGFVHTR